MTPMLTRWARFAVVGLLGLGVQVGTILLLTEVAGVHYAVATLIAIAGTVLHNFLWHERWTWADRPPRSPGQRRARLGRFTVLSALVAIAGGVALTALYVEWLGLPVAVANLIAVATVTAANFVGAHHLVFTPDGLATGAGASK